jgi:hypothetical protein
MAAILLLFLMGLLAGGAMRHESATIDEIAHTAAGVSYLQMRDMRMNEEHPPLAKVVAAVPLVLRGAHADYSSTSWTFSEKMFYQYLGEWTFGYSFLTKWNNPQTTLFWARIPMLLMTLLLGWVLFVFGTRLGGSPWGGLLCLAAYVSMPAFLAFGPLVITDTAITLFWILTVWMLAEMWRAPSRSKVILFGLALAGALLSKFSSGLLFVVFPAVALSLRLCRLPEQPTDRTERRAWRRRAWANIAKGTLWAAGFVYLVYLVLSWNQPTDRFSIIPRFPASPVLRRLLMPIGVYLSGLLGFAFSALSRPTYILGHLYPHGVWFYFPVLFFLKSPLAFLLLLLLTGLLAIAIKAKNAEPLSAIPEGSELAWRCMWVSLAIYATACLLSHLDLSIRHFSVPLGLIILLLAPLPRMIAMLRRTRPMIGATAAGVTAALAAASLVAAIWAYPNYMPYLNAVSMGRPGYELVNDSNLDWNHALPEVEAFVHQRGITHVLIDEYGFSDPAVYVPQAQDWNCQTPSAGDAGQWAVVSGNNIGDAHNCRWLLRYLQQTLAGGSMLAFRLPKPIPAAGAPGGPPLPQDYHYFSGMQFEGTDVKTIFIRFVRDPAQLEPTMKWVGEAMKAASQKNKH